MRYLSVCSGIEAASVAWEPLGWVPVAFAEIEKFPAAVLQTRYPHVPNLGDMTKINGADYKGKIDVLVGGTPCQSFSVAGLRGGLDDERGNLALEFVRIADESDPAFVIWENVPGIFSDRGNAFGCFLAALSGENAPLLPAGGRWTNAGYVLGTSRTIAWRVLDAQYFGLAQRRKRVFLVGCPVGGADPRKVLFEFDGLRRDSAPSREARAGIAGTLESSLGRSRGAGINPGAITSHWEGGAHPCLNQSARSSGGIGMSDQELFSQRRAGLVPHGYVPEIVSQAISCKWSKGTSGPAGDEHHNLVATALRGEGFDASEDGTGRQNLVVTPINTQVGLRHQALGERTGLGIGEPGDPAFTLQSAHSHAVCVAPPLTGNQYGDHESREGLLVPTQSPGTVLSFHGSQDPDVSGDVTHPLGTNQGQETCVMAFMAGQGAKAGGVAASKTLSPTLKSANSGGNMVPSVLLKSAVRRLTPVECERLQGFPDEYTAIPWHRIVRDVPLTVLEKSYRKYLKRMKRQGKHPLSFGDVLSCADGPRYKALGNSMAVPVMRWIGERIAGTTL